MHINLSVNVIKKTSIKTNNVLSNTHAPWDGEHYDAKWTDEISPPGHLMHLVIEQQREKANDVSHLDKATEWTMAWQST